MLNDYICCIGEVGESILNKVCVVGGGGVKVNDENFYYIIIVKKLYFDKIKEWYWIVIYF